MATNNSTANLSKYVDVLEDLNSFLDKFPDQKSRHSAVQAVQPATLHPNFDKANAFVPEHVEAATNTAHLQSLSHSDGYADAVQDLLSEAKYLDSLTLMNISPIVQRLRATALRKATTNTKQVSKKISLGGV